MRLLIKIPNVSFIFLFLLINLFCLCKPYNQFITITIFSLKKYKLEIISIFKFISYSVLYLSVCHLLPKNIILFITDSSQQSMEVYESMSSNLEIPIVLPRGPGYNHTSEYVFDMTPSFIGAIIDYIQYFGWKVVYYVYDSEESE